MGNSVRFKATMDDQVSGKLDRIRDNFDRLGKSKGAASILQGVGMGVGISAWNLLGSAVDKTVAFLGDAVRAAADEEQSIARLTSSLKANVPAWDGRTDAIDRAIEKGQDLAFADDEIRDSMALLVGATGDVNESLNIMATAQDLARFKGIDLKSASEALVKVEAGQYRILKSLGIELKAGATATEALAAVQKVAGGQAKAYGETTAGAMESFNIAVEELQESIGTALLPVVQDLAKAMRSDVIPAVEGVAGAIGEVRDQTPFLITMPDVLGEVTDAWDYLFQTLTTGTIPVKRQVEAYLDTADAMDSATESNASFREGVRKTGSQSYLTSRKLMDHQGDIRRSYARTAAYMLEQYTTNYSTAMGIVEARADLHNAKTDADRAEAYADLAALGALSVKDYDKWTASLERLAKGTRGKVHEAYMAAIADIKALKAAATGSIKVSVTYKPPLPGTEHRASGGPVLPGHAYTVGERGPEMLVMGQVGGSIIPNNRLPSGGGGSSGMVPVSIPIVIDGREIARVVDRHLYYEAARAPRSSYAG